MVTPPSEDEDAAGILPWSGRPEDFWDRPESDWGDAPGSDVVLEARHHANSCFRLGPFALDIKQSGLAANWLHAGMKQDHLVPNRSSRFPARFCSLRRQRLRLHALSREACSGPGHGDAQQMLPLLANQAAHVPTFATWQDPEYGPEIFAALQNGPG